MFDELCKFSEGRFFFSVGNFTNKYVTHVWNNMWGAEFRGDGCYLFDIKLSVNTKM